MSNEKSTQTGIGDRLRYLIDTMGVTATGFAALVDIPYRSLQNYLRDEREPAASALKKISDALPNVNLHWLVTGNEHEMFSDYPPKKEIDKLILILFPSMLDAIMSEKRFSDQERRTLLMYMCQNRTLGLKDAIQTLFDDGYISDVDQLKYWKEYLNDATGRAPEPRSADRAADRARVRRQVAERNQRGREAREAAQVAPAVGEDGGGQVVPNPKGRSK